MSKKSSIRSTSSKTEKPMRVAVTGGSGRIGSHVVEQLVERGHTVLNLDRREANNPVARFVYLDLRQREMVQPIFEQVDAVCHLAEIPNVGGSISPEDVFSHNTQVGSVVLQTAADLKLRRMIYTSTAQVYGCWGEPQVPALVLPMDETHPLQPQNAYSLGKAANEEYARMVSRRQGISTAIFRFPWVIDWDVERDENLVWDNLERSRGKAEGMFTYVHVSDAARAFVLALENPRPGCEAYHFTAVEIYSAIPLRERMEKFHPRCPPLPASWPTFKSPVSTEKAKKHFGWEPKWNMLEMYRKKFGRDPK
jgi:nucleoside-diphosphate-sugar epimerase